MFESLKRLMVVKSTEVCGVTVSLGDHITPTLHRENQDAVVERGGKVTTIERLNGHIVITVYLGLGMEKTFATKGPDWFRTIEKN